ncbi:hypothetical protein [Deinococcus peraridilitoris]|uniref:Uncharacterized protein n=1 Tax=Deinococcus peraridilitoris (strain DSM 19664 / LMG 22246 / CIP 109416 / KR-200) TaxID=937777 RepID=L0A8H6_DEIPD|nr:hypothetical protein [Deinococcus peraridilitoris]AFZ69385.1 hypothetical protein Deipe_3984 [Deinococcus peraridilitoris DSM 19664]
MTTLQAWLDNFPNLRVAPLFEVDGLTVRTHPRGSTGERRVLTRSAEFDSAMIDLVEAGLKDDRWQGLVYLMGWGERAAFVPLYIGKAEKRGKSQTISANLKNLRSNHGFFARWGYNTDYHVGDLSHAIFEWTAYRPPTKKYRRWAEVLFASYDPPVLRAGDDAAAAVV